VPANRQALLKAAGFGSVASAAAALVGEDMGEHDAGQSAAIAKAIAEEINKDIKAGFDAALQPAVEAALLKIFSDPESVGPRFAKLIAGYVADSEGLYGRAFDDDPTGDEHDGGEAKSADPLDAMFA
jgi:hypothetical protein